MLTFLVKCAPNTNLPENDRQHFSYALDGTNLACFFEAIREAKRNPLDAPLNLLRFSKTKKNGFGPFSLSAR
jgi:hypothetical protein